jgi:hypothetical protein
MVLSRIKAASLALALTTLASPAMAGPPYVTDDPEPTDTGHWEVYGFASGVGLKGDTAAQSGFDINYGAAKDLQLTLVAPVDYDQDKKLTVGAGSVELGAKYRFIHQSEGGWTPDVSFFPSINLPTAGRRVDSGRMGLFLPFWAQKDFGDWSTFGGGGYQINPGPENRDYWLTGWAATRKITDKLQLGAEIYHQTRDAVDHHAFTGLGVGLTYQFAKHFAFIASGGPSVAGQRQTLVYTAIEFTY